MSLLLQHTNRRIVWLFRAMLAASLLCFAVIGSAHSQAASEPDAQWQPVIAALRARIAHEMADKQLPAIAIALVDDQRVIWAEGFGYQDPAHKVAATADTVFRVGSVSKLFTDIGVMQLVQAGKLNLDAPVTTYLPTFNPNNPFSGEITLRELMSHRSGLVREPPVGHYFDTSEPSLQATVDSLNQTTLVYAPGTQTKYSNAAVATVGYALQTVSGQPYADYLRGAVLLPMGMTHSSFKPEPALMSHLAEAQMWSYDGLNFAAPKFQLGEGPAGCMYSTVGDLGRFLSVLFAAGESGRTQVISKQSLGEMWTPQFTSASTTKFGLGFLLGTFKGERMIGHGGAIYGFATQVAALPDRKLGVVVIATADSTNAVMNHIGDDALSLMLSVREHKPLPELLTTTAIPVEVARKAAGHYSGSGAAADLGERSGHLVLSRPDGGELAELKAEGSHWIRDGRVDYSEDPIVFSGDGSATDTLTVDGKLLHRESVAMPVDAPKEIADLLGEYGWDFDKLFVFEDHGKLSVLIEWFDDAPLEQVSLDTYKFLASGLYQGESAVFQRAADGTVTGVKVGGVLFPRLSIQADDTVFQIKPLKPVEELRREALLSKPPVEHGDFHPTDLVELTKLDPSIKLDIRYATSRNFLAAPLYLQARAYMQRPAAEAVVRASAWLHSLGYGLLIHDSYRPWYVTKMFWDGTPDDKKIFVADPSQGSRHNRGCAVDLTLYDLKTGKPIRMTGGYDEMSERSYPFYPGGTSVERWHRDLLRKAMEREGFAVYGFEWWHFDYYDYPHFRIGNATFEDLDRAAEKK
jgi:CubicO group peptidase (beta-lactamase class C family)/D-alanyl-D-alanine dipeptidase